MVKINSFSDDIVQIGRQEPSSPKTENSHLFTKLYHITPKLLNVPTISTFVLSILHLSAAFNFHQFSKKNILFFSKLHRKFQPLQ